MNRAAIVVTAIALAVGVVSDIVVGHTPFAGYAALIGLGGCTAIVVVSRWLGTTFLQRPEDYYEEPDDGQEGQHDR